MINIPVTLDQAQRTAVMNEIRSTWPATQGTTQAISVPGRFCIRPLAGALPADLTVDAVRTIVLAVLATQEATRPDTFRTTRPYDRSGQRTRKPRHASWGH